MVTRAREAAGLSKRELARRAGTSAAAVVEYESGRRDPNAATLARLLRAADFDLRIVPRAEVVDDDRNGRILLEVLGLAEHLPTRRASPELPYPRFPT